MSNIAFPALIALAAFLSGFAFRSRFAVHFE